MEDVLDIQSLLHNSQPMFYSPSTDQVFSATTTHSPGMPFPIGGSSEAFANGPYDAFETSNETYLQHELYKARCQIVELNMYAYESDLKRSMGANLNALHQDLALNHRDLDNYRQAQEHYHQNQDGILKMFDLRLQELEKHKNESEIYLQQQKAVYSPNIDGQHIAYKTNTNQQYFMENDGHCINNEENGFNKLQKIASKSDTKQEYAAFKPDTEQQYISHTVNTFPQQLPFEEKNERFICGMKKNKRQCKWRFDSDEERQKHYNTVHQDHISLLGYKS